MNCYKNLYGSLRMLLWTENIKIWLLGVIYSFKRLLKIPDQLDSLQDAMLNGAGADDYFEQFLDTVTDETQETSAAKELPGDVIRLIHSTLKEGDTKLVRLQVFSEHPPEDGLPYE